MTRPTPTTESTARTVKHPAHQEGSRTHVLSYHGGIILSRHIAWVRCSERACEVNEEARRELGLCESRPMSTTPPASEMSDAHYGHDVEQYSDGRYCRTCGKWVSR